MDQLNRRGLRPPKGIDRHESKRIIPKWRQAGARP